MTKYHPALLEDSAPLQTIGDGNCLYRAISKLLTGHEESHKLIRLEVALELIIFSDRYDAKSKKKLEFLNDSRIVTSDIHKLIKDAIRLGSFSEMAHMYAASAAINKPIIVNDHATVCTDSIDQAQSFMDTTDMSNINDDDVTDLTEKNTESNMVTDVTNSDCSDTNIATASSTLYT